MSISVKPAFSKNNLGIVFSTDANYLAYMAVSIQSIIDNSDSNYNYDILVFDDGITDYQKEQLSRMLKSNFSLRYIDVKALLQNFDSTLFISRGIWSVATFYRLFIPEVLVGYDKVLYLDCDILVMDSLVDLFKTDLNGYMSGCVYDCVRYMPSRNRIKDIEVLGVSDYKKYFNSGVILFNTKEIDKDKFQKEFMHILKTKNLPFLDQDILNVIMRDKYLPLDFGYNYQYHILNEHPELKNLKDLSDAAQNPKILHYTTATKPWNTPSVPMADKWWAVARTLPFYEEIIYKNTKISNKYLHSIIYKNRYIIRYAIIKLMTMISFGKVHRKLKKLSKSLQPQIRAIKKFCRNK